MATFGTETIFSFVGRVPTPAHETSLNRRSGVDGEDVHDGGIHGRSRSVQLVGHYASTGARLTARTNLLLMDSGLITIVDDFGEVWPNILVQSIETENMENRLGDTNNTPYHLLMRAQIHGII